MKIYTANIGDYDPPRKDDVLTLSQGKLFKEDVRNARCYKILSHKYFPNEDITIWLDANIHLKEDTASFLDWFLGDNDIATWEHPYRDCVYDEANELIRLSNHPKFAFRHDFQEQLEHLKETGYPKNNGLAETNVLVRRNTPEVNRFNEAWFAELCRYSHRDQLSFNPIINQFPLLKVKYNKGDVRYHPSFEYEQH